MTVDLTSTYLGLTLRSPVVASASPLARHLDTMQALDDAGVGAVVLPSLFEEQVSHDARTIAAVLAMGTGITAEAEGFFPDLGAYDTGTGPYLAHLERAAGALEAPVIASLNGTTPGGWTSYARQLEGAGAAAIELNTYSVAADPLLGGREVEDRLVDLVEAVRAEVSVPLAVKLSPYWSALASLAVRLVGAGADGLVLFNRFVQPDVDLDEMALSPGVTLSGPGELLLPLRWVGILRPLVPGSLGLTTGVHRADDVVKALAVGADVAMTTSALLRHGPRHVRTLNDGLASWLVQRGYRDVSQLRGSLSRANAPDPEAYERAHYLQSLAAGPR